MLKTSTDAAQPLIVIGASTRAAATSALRAGWTPWCADLFGDADLERIAPVRKVASNRYPDELIDALKEAPPGPVMYTGALENRPDLIAKIDRPILGNSADVVRAIRTPERWTECLQAQGIPCPAIADKPPATGRWLLKPRRSAGGVGVREYTGQSINPHTHFLQEQIIEGAPCSAVFRADHNDTILLGATRQFVGTSWLNASGFQYAGSIGPYLIPGPDERWRDIGFALASTFHLRGVFGVDAIMRNGVPWPIEINPRYTASVEVLERYSRHSLLEPAPTGLPPRFTEHLANSTGLFWGKAILFARRPFVFPADGPWIDALTGNPDLDATEYGDIPHAGDSIAQGQPVLTFFASAWNVMDCEQSLKEKAQTLDRCLWG